MRWLALVTIAACGSPAAERPLTFGGDDRPVKLEVPPAFDEAMHYPLVLLLHGYTINGFVQEAYLGLKTIVDTNEAFIVAPTGTVDHKNKPFWNADPACCDFDHLGPDDVGYLSALVDDIADAWPIDRDAMFIIGDANGGFMAYRLACEHAETFASVVVIAGAAGLDPATCTPSQPVNVLHLHGTADPEFPFAGGGMFGMTPGSPGAVESVARWAALDGCTAHAAATPIDLDTIVAGPETTPDIYSCPAPLGVELWSMAGSDHLPNLTNAFVPAVWPWLLDHTRRAAR